MGSNPGFYGLALIDESGFEYRFTSLPIHIGRAATNELILKDETVSANHAKVFLDETLQELCIADLGSLNGVFINSRPTIYNILSDGMQIDLGDVCLMFRDFGFIPASE